MNIFYVLAILLPIVNCQSKVNDLIAIIYEIISYLIDSPKLAWQWNGTPSSAL